MCNQHKHQTHIKMKKKICLHLYVYSHVKANKQISFETIIDSPILILLLLTSHQKLKFLYSIT